LTIQSGPPDNCEDTVSMKIIIDGPSSVKVPNAFSPNMDGFNDVFRVKLDKITELQVLIMDRWGTKIYEFNSPEGFWDGRISGQDAPDGVYFFILKAKGIDGKSHTAQGSVTLIR
jgi:gliding motility-associated-like protein